MAVDINKWTTDGTTGRNLVFYGRVFNNLPAGVSTAALANGADSGLGLLKGITGMTLPADAATTVPVIADGVVTGSHVAPPTAPPDWSFEMLYQDLTWEAVFGPGVVQEIGDWRTMTGTVPCRVYNDVCWVVNRPALSRDTGAGYNSAGWDVFINLRTKTHFTMENTTPRSVGVFPQAVMTTPVGATLTNVLHGTTKQFSYRFFSDYPVTMHTFVGDGADTSFVLTYTPVEASQDAVAIWQGGTQLTYNDTPSGATQYSVTTATKTVTFGAAQTAGNICVVLYKFNPNEAC